MGIFSHDEDADWSEVYFYKNKADKYKSALEEIREIVRADCKGCTADCDCDEDCTRHKIKNKIEEVLNEK